MKILFAALALAILVKPAAEAKPMDTKTEFAVFGGGCFWCMEAVFTHVPGVKAITCGFAGGHTRNPTYKEVCTDTTGHAEVVRIEFDPAVTTYENLLKIFWEAHDPTTVDRQGGDEGSQYRSAIFCTGEAQKAAAEKAKVAAQAGFSDPIVTEILPLRDFFPAEDYHQRYFEKHPGEGYCRMVIRPKV